MKQINIKAGEKKRIISQFSNSLQQSHKFLAETLKNDEELEGIVEIKGSNWLFPKEPFVQELKTENEVAKGAWDSFYSVYVTPRNDTKITLISSLIKNLWLYIIVALLIISIASSIFFNSI